MEFILKRWCGLENIWGVVSVLGFLVFQLSSEVTQVKYIFIYIL